MAELLSGKRRYDHLWNEVQDINSYAMLVAYVSSATRGIGFLVVTWTTVVLLGGFVSTLHKPDFWRLMLITLVEILWINESFTKRLESGSVFLIFWNFMKKSLSTRKWRLADKVPRDHPKLGINVAAVCGVVARVYNLFLALCILCMLNLFGHGLFITTALSIYGLVKKEYHGDTDDGGTNMYLAHNVLYALCVAQGALLLYNQALIIRSDGPVNQVSKAYGFQDGSREVSDYFYDIVSGYVKNRSFAGERNLVTYAIKLLESESPSKCLSGALILDRLLTRQYSDQIKGPTFIQQEDDQGQEERMDCWQKWKKKREEAIILQPQTVIKQQRTVIKKLIGSASSSHILQKLLQALDSRRSYNKKMRRAAARIVEHVAGGIRLEQFPRGINCISSLVNNFEEYRRLQPDESSSSSPSDTDEAATTIVPPSSNIDEAATTIMSRSSSTAEAATTIMLRSSSTAEAATTIVPPTSNTSESNGDDEEQTSYSSSESELELKLEWEVPASVYSESEPESESYNDIHQPSSSKALHRYNELVLTGLRILWSLAGSEDNCRIISNTNHLVSKIMAPVHYDLVHRSSHSAWSTSLVEASMRVMLRLIMTAKDTKGDTGAVLCQQISNNETITSMEKIVTCEECKGGELQMMSMQILMELGRCSFTKLLVDFFIKGNCSNASIRKRAGKELVMLFLSSKNVAAILPKEDNIEFVCCLAEMVSHAGNEEECRKAAADILEHMCIHYSENDEYLLNQKEKYDEYLRKKKENVKHLNTLKYVMVSVMPEILREMLLGCGLTGEEGKSGYVSPGTDLESQIPCRPPIIPPQDRIMKMKKKRRRRKKKKNNKTFSFPWQNQHHKLYIALLSLYVTACEKLHLDIDAISPGEGGQGEGVAFRFAMQMVQSSRDGFSEDSLRVIKLSTRMFIATLTKIRETNRRVIRSADLESLMDSLTSISETMLVLEGSMVFTTGKRMTVPATADTLNSLVVRARKLHSEVKNQLFY